jgi:DNA-binding beta-propeller fold protein YncE
MLEAILLHVEQMNSSTAIKTILGKLLLVVFVLGLPDFATPAPLAYVPNANDQTVAALDIARNSINATVPTGGISMGLHQGVAVSRNGSPVYVESNCDDVLVIDTSTDTAIVPVPVDNVWIVGGLAVSADGLPVYLCHTNFYNKSLVATISAIINTVTATVWLPLRPAVAVTSDGALVLVAASDISVVATAGDTVIANIPVAAGPTGLVATPEGTKVYVTNYGPCTASENASTTHSVIAAIPVAGGPSDVAQLIGPDMPCIGLSNYIFATTDTTPGGGHPGAMFLFPFKGTCPPTPLPPIQIDMADSPNYGAFSTRGELLVSNHLGRSVSHFTIDAN